MNTKQQILEFLRTIPKWKVASYQFVWKQFWVHQRAVAAAMRTNHDPDTYPCYKVVAKNGKISWYSAYDWVESKLETLKNDGIEIIGGKIPAKYFIW